jgi:response regulator RpfG family c-di-GMP phosphodiesterase
MTSKILLVGYQSEAMQEMYDLLYGNKLYNVIRVQSNEQMIQKLASQTINLTIMDQDVLNVEKMTQIKNMRMAGYGTPLLLVSRAISAQAKELSRSMNRIALLEKPYEYKDFIGITNKLVAGREVTTQAHKRFFTNQTAVLEPVGGGSQYTTYMKNLSKGGALLEVPNATSEDIRGIVRMNVILDQVQRAYEVNARVVWNSKRNSNGGQTIGVEFIQAKDVYRNLLNNL